MANEIITYKKTKLSYKASGDTYTDLTDLVSIPSLGGTTESIEVTTLADDAHMYIPGLITYGDSIDFKFYWRNGGTQFLALDALDGSIDWKVTLGDGTTATFSGECSVSLEAGEVATAMTYILSIKPNSKITLAAASI